MDFAKPEAQAVIDVVKELHVPHVVSLPEGQSLVVVPKGMDVHSTKKWEDERRLAPERRKGIATFFDIASFVAFVQRFKDEHTVIFANPDPDRPSLTVVIDYNEKTYAGAPRFGQHRGTYGFPLSDEWKAWHEAAGEHKTQEDFAEFIEGRILDVVMPTDLQEKTAEMLKVVGTPGTPTRIMEVAKGLQINVNRNVKNVVNTSTGENQFRFDEAHTDAAGAPVTVPQCFVIAIPVFRGDAEYDLVVRLRYRLREHRIMWFVEPFRAEAIFASAFEGAVAQVTEETGVPVFLGSPEVG